MQKKAVIIGNSDGIGLAFTQELLSREWQIAGISRSDSPIDHPRYQHIRAEVQNSDYTKILTSVLENEGPVDLCVYCAGIGEKLDPSKMDQEVLVFEVNLMGMIKTASTVIPAMVRNGKGHFMGLSSVLDELLSTEAPSYHASKAAFSSYMLGVALAVRSSNVHVTNIRFGFVETKLPRAHAKPFIISVDQAAQHMIKCMETKPVQYTFPWRLVWLLKLRKWKMLREARKRS